MNDEKKSLKYCEECGKFYMPITVNGGVVKTPNNGADFSDNMVNSLTKADLERIKTNSRELCPVHRKTNATMSEIAEHLKSSPAKWPTGDPKPFGVLFDISHNEHNIFLYWSDTWRNHDQIFPVSLIMSAIKHVNEVSPVKVTSRNCDVYTFDDDRRRGLYLCIGVNIRSYPFIF